MGFNFNGTPRASRLHIGIFGKRNAGKSSLINVITEHETALVSDIAGTTADPVYKSMEIYGIGPCVLFDTAGFDDEGDIGRLRIEKTYEAALKTDIAIIVFDGTGECFEREMKWIDIFKERKTPVIAVLNKSDLLDDPLKSSKHIENAIGIKPIIVSTKEKTGIENIHHALIRHLPEDYDVNTITGGIVNEGDLVLLVMPQDAQAPKGRLILPQAQTIRELLDRSCIVISVSSEEIDTALGSLGRIPDVIITDSRVFKTVYEKKPDNSKLTSFSVLFAGYKGDLGYFTESAAAIDGLTEDSHVLIAEACTHAPVTEDIGRVKIPELLRGRIGEKLKIDVVSGVDFPKNLSGYDIIIHCGGCMFNRKYVLLRVDRAKEQNIPMTNYGIVIAYLSGILDKINLR